ncbi:hypothetical protein ACFMI7_23645, partial [Acinetobacter baumannii]
FAYCIWGFLLSLACFHLDLLLSASLVLVLKPVLLAIIPPLLYKEIVLVLCISYSFTISHNEK